jgi:hypothetical protein
MAKRKGKSYVRGGIYSLGEVLPFVFTKDVRHNLRKKGYNYQSPEWISASRRSYSVMVDGEEKTVVVSMGSHRYQLYANKGIVCANCGLEGKYFVLERGKNDDPDKFHFNLYGRNKHGHEVMLTKDHIFPKSEGGKNKLSNYQPLCFRCNQKKANKIPESMKANDKRM